MPERAPSPAEQASKSESRTRAGTSAAPPRSGVAWLDHAAELGAPLQFEARDPASAISGAELRQRVADGFSGSALPLPHLSRIQPAFGEHGRELGRVRAHVGGPAAIAARALGASAYASGHSIAFSKPPDLRTAAHEAAHVVQQRAGVVEGVGRAGDAHEQEADAVADAVVAGRPASRLFAGAGGGEVPAVQRSMLVGNDPPLLGPPSLIKTVNIPHVDPKALRAAELAERVAEAKPIVGDKDSSKYFQAIALRQLGAAYVLKLPHLAVDNDGAPNAYHPPVQGMASGKITYPGKRRIIDHIANATNQPKRLPYLDAKGNVKLPEWDTIDPKTKKKIHHQSRWVGVVLEDGKPVVQGDSDPFPGAYISQSTLHDEHFTRKQVGYQADANVIPYVALPGFINAQTQAGTGDLVAVVMLSDPGPKRRRSPRVAFGIVGDVAPSASLGEASRAMCGNLGVPGGITEKNAEFVWIVFPGSRERDAAKSGWWKNVGELQARAQTEFEAWGGLELIEALFPAPLPPLRLADPLPPNAG